MRVNCFAKREMIARHRRIEKYPNPWPGSRKGRKEKRQTFKNVQHLHIRSEIIRLRKPKKIPAPRNSEQGPNCPEIENVCSSVQNALSKPPLANGTSFETDLIMYCHTWHTIRKHRTIYETVCTKTPEQVAQLWHHALGSSEIASSPSS